MSIPRLLLLTPLADERGRSVITGGIEALYQLGAALRKHGVNAYLSDPFCPNPPATPADYSVYAMPRLAYTDRHPNDLRIIPEYWVHRLCSEKSDRILIWWLSIDNAFVGLRSIRGASFLPRCLRDPYLDVAHMIRHTLGIRALPNRDQWRSTR